MASLTVRAPRLPPMARTSTVVGHADGLCLCCKKFIGHPGIGILLLEEGGDALFLRLFQYGATGITADSYGNVGLEVAHDTARLAQ